MAENKNKNLTYDNEKQTQVVTISNNLNIRHLYSMKLSSESNFKKKHCLFLLLSGLTFTFAGFCYLPPYQEILEGEYLGGYMLALGSIFLFTASLIDYDFCKNQVESNSEIISKSNSKKDCLEEGFLHSSVGVNYLMNLIGSFVFIFGGICFIPQTGMIDLAYYLIDIGNLIIFVSQTWKVIRMIDTNEEDELLNADNELQPFNQNKDIKANKNKYESYFKLESITLFCFAEVLHGLNGLFYLIATYYMPTISWDDLVYLTYMYISAGLVIIASSLVLMYKYFYDNEYDSIKLEINDQINYKILE